MSSNNLVFLCPLTKRGIDSGFDSDNVSRSRMKKASVRLKCPHCGNRHEFAMGDSFGRINERPEDDTARWRGGAIVMRSFGEIAPANAMRSTSRPTTFIRRRPRPGDNGRPWNGFFLFAFICVSNASKEEHK
jgi:hypothetical protein